MRNFIALFIFLIAVPVVADKPRNSVEVTEDRSTLTTRIRVSADNGKVSSAGLFRGVSRLNGYDDGELVDVLPSADVSVDNSIAKWMMNKFNWIMAPCVNCTIGRDNAGQNVEITVDRQAARQWVNGRKAQVRSTWNKVDWRHELPEYGVQLLRGPDDVGKRDIVLLIHGLNSRPEDLHALVPAIDEAGLVPATFRYPNDQPIDLSSKLLAEELLHLKVDYPGAKIRLLTHSMGGLVARGAIEFPKLDPGNVTQLIMIAPPNQGSSLARVATFMDCYECFTSADHRRFGIFVESVSDGLGEATADLQPRSVYLDKLNRQKRNPQVSYTILLGTDGPMDEAEMTKLRQTVRDYSDDSRIVRFVSSKLNHALADLDEVVDGCGDGVVCVKRGRLDGVDDIIELPFSHSSILFPAKKSSQQAYQIIVDRLK